MQISFGHILRHEICPEVSTASPSTEGTFSLGPATRKYKVKSTCRRAGLLEVFYVRVILGKYWDNGKEKGNQCLGFRVAKFRPRLRRLGTRAVSAPEPVQAASSETRQTRYGKILGTAMPASNASSMQT